MYKPKVICTIKNNAIWTAVGLCGALIFLLWETFYHSLKALSDIFLVDGLFDEAHSNVSSTAWVKVEIMGVSIGVKPLYPNIYLLDGRSRGKLNVLPCPRVF